MNCVECGVDFERHWPNTNSVVCSLECKRKRVAAQTRANVTTYDANSICLRCGKSYYRKTDSRRRTEGFCSRSCSSEAATAARRTAPYQVRSFVYVRPCRECSLEFLAQGNQAYCSRDCRLEAGRRKWREAAPLLRARPIFDCRQCGVEVRPKYGTKLRAFCSKRCARRWQRVNRGKTGRHITIAALGERDQWRCHICGKRVSAHQASADHIVPRKFNGSSSPVNLRLAHISCNSRRGAGRIPAQALLFDPQGPKNPELVTGRLTAALPVRGRSRVSGVSRYG